MKFKAFTTPGNGKQFLLGAVSASQHKRKNKRNRSCLLLDLLGAFANIQQPAPKFFKFFGADSEVFSFCTSSFLRCILFLSVSSLLCLYSVPYNYTSFSSRHCKNVRKQLQTFFQTEELLLGNSTV